MNRKLPSYILLITAVMLLSSVVLALPCFAADDKDRVLDYAFTLSDNQEIDLNEKLGSASEEMQLDLVFLTTNFTYGKTTEQYAADVYDNTDGSLPERFGYGGTFDGLLICVDFENREIYYLGTGRGEDYTSYEQTEFVLDEIWDSVENDDYYMVGVNFIAAVKHLVNYGLPDEYEDYPYDDPYAKKEGVKIFGIETPYTAGELFGKAVIGVIIGLIAAAITTSSMKSKLKSVRLETGASGYAVKNSLNLTNQTDHLMYANVSRIARSTDSGSGRTGGSRPSGMGHSHSSFSGSSGTHHSGGGRKF